MGGGQAHFTLAPPSCIVVGPHIGHPKAFYRPGPAHQSIKQRIYHPTVHCTHRPHPPSLATAQVHVPTFWYIFETEFHVAQVGLNLLIFLPPLPKSWDYRYVSPNMVYTDTGFLLYRWSTSYLSKPCTNVTS